MSVTEIKDELKALQPEELDQIAALILQLRRANDSQRPDQLKSMIDNSNIVRLDSIQRD